MTAKRQGEIASRTRSSVEYPPSKLWTYDALAAHAAVSKDTIRRMVEAGDLEVVYCKGTPRVPHWSFLQFLATPSKRKRD